MPDARTAAEIEAELAEIQSNTSDLPGEGEGTQSEGVGAKAPVDYDYEAGRKGWVPKEKYKGDPSKWVDAKTFVERGEKFSANLQKDIEGLKRKLAEFEGTKKQVEVFYKAELAKSNAQLKEALTALRIQRSAAIREGEDELAVELEDRMDALKEQQRKAAELEVPAASAEEAIDPVMLEWIADGNEWFKDNPKLRDYSVQLGMELKAELEKEGTYQKGRKFLDEVSRRMAEEFPRQFKKDGEGTKPRPLGEGGRPSNGKEPGSVDGKTERDLPAVDRSIMMELIRDGLMTKEAFLKSYFSRNG